MADDTSHAAGELLGRMFKSYEANNPTPDDWLQRLCRALAYQAVYAANPHLLAGAPPRGPTESPKQLRARAEEFANNMLNFARNV